MAADAVHVVGVRELRDARAIFRRLRDDVEYVRDAREVPRLRAPVEVDVVPQLPRLVFARRLVCGGVLSSLSRDLAELFENNRRWAAGRVELDPQFFHRLLQQQVPAYLWIGCSDSRVPANEIVGLLPGELFVHRNVANVVAHSDLNCLSVLQYAVDVLRVRHVIVCGHYGCGGVRAAYDRAKFGLIDNWLRHVQDVRHKHAHLLDDGSDPTEHVDRLCELNVLEQANNVCGTTIVQDAWARNQDLTVHALIYRLSDGLLRDLGLTASSYGDVAPAYASALARIGIQHPERGREADASAGQ
jgi:carbonic anhydrase